jgi:hydroxyacylglutathione hydrolase
MRIDVIPCLQDNYAYLIVCEQTGESAVVDPSEAAPVFRAVEKSGTRLRAIWCTHHHGDHVGGVEELTSRFDVEVMGHVSDRGRIPGQTRGVEDGSEVSVGSLTARVLHVPGHTTGAIAYVLDDAVFTGDTLFLGGAGRLFEGTASQMEVSLGRLAALSPQTRVYCGHEYTEANLRFSAHVERSNVDVAKAIEQARRQVPTVPGTIEQELRTNPFLRLDALEIRQALGIAPGADRATALAAVRGAKNAFR